MSDRLMKAKARHASQSGQSTNQRFSTSTHSSLNSVNSQFSGYSYAESIASGTSYRSNETMIPHSSKPQVVLGDALVVEKALPQVPVQTAVSVSDIYDAYSDDKRLSMGSFSDSSSDFSDSTNNEFLLQAIRDSASHTEMKVDFHQTHHADRGAVNVSEQKFTGLGYQSDLTQAYNAELTTHKTHVSLSSLSPAPSNHSAAVSTHGKDSLGDRLRGLKTKFIK